MAETVGQHSVAAFTSPVNGTTPIDANTVRGNDNTVRSAYVDHDADPGIHVQSSSLASRPTAGTAGRKWITVSSGRYQLWYDDGSRWHEVASDAVNVDCLADANLTKGDVVKVTGFNNGQNLPTVNKVSASTDTAFGIVENTVTSGNIVQIVNTGLIEDVDTNGYAVGTILYPNSSGGWTTTKPTSGNYQPAGYVLRGNTNNGVLYVEFSAPRIVERSDNTASTIVLRDASGNFSAGTITAGALTSTGLVTFASLKGTGATTVTNILDEDNMASDSATALATQQSIKAYVDAQIVANNELSEVLANGNTTGANNIIVTNGQKITTNTIDETTAAAGVTIDSVLLKDNAVTATTFNGTLNGAAPAGSLSGTTLASNVVSSSLTSVGTLANLTVTNPISGSVTGSSGSTTGNAATATALQTARNINGVSFNGTADITVTAAAGTLTGTTLASGVTASSLTSVGTLTSLTVSGDLTVDTSTLKVDAANNRVGVGTASPGQKFVVYESLTNTNAYAVIENNRARNAAVLTKTTNGGFYTGTSIGTDTLCWQVYDEANGERMRLDASGNLGLGVTPDAGAKMTVAGGILSTGAFSATTGSTAGFDYSGGSMRFFSMGTSGSTKGSYSWIAKGADNSSSTPMTLDASGNLGVGVSPSARFHVLASNIPMRVASSTTSLYTEYLHSTSTVVGYIGNGNGVITGTGDANFAVRAQGVLLFASNGDAERARITSGGYFKASPAGTYNDSTGAYHEIRNNNAGSNAVWLTHTHSSDPYGPYINFSAAVPPNNATNYFIACVDTGGTRATIRSNGGLANYQANDANLSDERVKTDIKPVGSYWDKFKAIEIVTFKYVDQTHDDDNIGVIAQQVEAVAPEFIDVDGFGETPEDGVPLKTVYTTDMYHASIKALQEAMARIEALEARLEALEA